MTCMKQRRQITITKNSRRKEATTSTYNSNFRNVKGHTIGACRHTGEPMKLW